ncbi:MAG TPA: PilN domain-containing protein [Symbiobacteriaceae bacterium]|nr:PilN domain-containing protein [Symbiobacteriaceae bacterium]
MTVRINFLPRNYQPPKQMGAKETGVAVAVALAVVATGAYYATVYAGTADMERQVAADQSKLQTVQALLAEADDIKSREARVLKAEQDLKALAGRHWSGVMLTLSQLTPQHVTWRSMKADGSTISLGGSAKSLFDVAQLMGGLVTETTVEQVSLKVVTEKNITLTMTVKPDGKQPATVDQKAVTEMVQQIGEVRQLDFEMTITLTPAEGRELPHGA